MASFHVDGGPRVDPVQSPDSPAVSRASCNASVRGRLATASRVASLARLAAVTWRPSSPNFRTLAAGSASRYALACLCMVTSTFSCLRVSAFATQDENPSLGTSFNTPWFDDSGAQNSSCASAGHVENGGQSQGRKSQKRQLPLPRRLPATSGRRQASSRNYVKVCSRNCLSDLFVGQGMATKVVAIWILTLGEL